MIIISLIINSITVNEGILWNYCLIIFINYNLYQNNSISIKKENVYCFSQGFLVSK